MGLAAAVLWIAPALMPSLPASADDSFAAVEVGGIEFRKTDAISMRREDLFLSTSQVRASFEFENLTSSDVAATIAFPIPSYGVYDANDEGCGVGASACSVDSSVAAFSGGPFATRVNGREIQARLETKAFVGDRDVTSLLAKHSIPIDDGPKAADAIKRLPDADREELKAQGLWASSDPAYIQLGWKVRKIHSWEQAFPARSVTRIEHAYAPIVGGSQYHPSAPPDDRWVRDFCIDASTAKAMQSLKPRPGAPILFTTELDYVLTTANNWSGPIKDFHLTIEKPEGSVVSLCAEGLKKTGPRRFEARIADFTPPRDLKILFVRP